MRRLLIVTAMVGSVGLGLRAWQAPVEAPPTFRAGVDVVRIDVSVLDNHRTPVTGLTAADFTVLEDGKPRPVVSFMPVDLPEVAPERPDTAAWTREVAPGDYLLTIDATAGAHRVSRDLRFERSATTAAR